MTKHAKAAAERSASSGADEPKAKAKTAKTYSGQVLKLSDAAAKDDVQALARKVLRTQSSAATFLQQAGIATASGNLSKRFGG